MTNSHSEGVGSLNSMPHRGRIWPWWRWGLTGLSLAALTMSVYLSWHSLVGESMAGCGSGSPCDQVLSSRWSTIGGVLPVSGLAAGTFLAILAASLYVGPATPAPDRRLAWGTMLVLVGAAAGSAIWFTIVQQWIVGEYCPYCMATHTISLLLAVLVFWQVTNQFGDDSTDDWHANPAQPSDAGDTASLGDRFPARTQRTVGRWYWTGLTMAGMTLACIVAVCQIAFEPAPVALVGDSPDDLPAFDSQAVPLVGSPNAPYIVTLLFDYKCPHCQQLHFMLDGAVRHFDGKVAFALRPTPLNTQCNPHVSRDVEEFSDSCELARVGLTVWVAEREAYPAFQRWMFSFDSGDRWQPRSLEAAEAKAIELVGQTKFAAAKSDPWIDRYMQASVQVFRDTGGSAIPKLVFGSRWVIPGSNEIDNLVAVLQNNLEIPRP